MANVKISDLTAAGAASGTQEFEVNDSLTSKKVSGDQIKTFVNADRVQKTSDTGSVVVPAGTEAQRDGSPSAGYLRFNSDAGSFEGYNGAEWGSIGGGATSDAVYENSAIIAEDITIVTGRNGMSTGPITINSGVTVTVESGARYVVI